MGLKDALRNRESNEPNASMRLKLRPFSVLIHTGDRPLESSPPLLKFMGEIFGDTYSLSIDAARFHIAASATGADEFGPYALVSEVTSSFAGGFSVEVESVDDEDENLGTVVVISREDPPASCLAAYFGLDGTTSILKELDSDEARSGG